MRNMVEAVADGGPGMRGDGHGGEGGVRGEGGSGEGRYVQGLVRRLEAIA